MKQQTPNYRTSRGQTPPRLLLVEDQPDLVSALAEIFENHGFAVVSTLEGEDAVDIAPLYRPSIIVTDFQLPGIDGVTVIEKIRQVMPELRAILLSGYLSRQTRQRARAGNVDAMFQKPVRVTDLLASLSTPS